MNIRRSINYSKPGSSGFSLLELMISMSIGVIVLGVAIVTMGFMNRTLDATGNYAELDRQSRNALDQMSRDIRMAGGMTNFSTTSLWFTNLDGTSLIYSWNTNTGYLVCSNFALAGIGRSNLLLRGCKDLKFSVFQRAPLTNSTMLFTPIPNPNATNYATVKVIVMDWICVRTNTMTLTDSESVQTAKVVLRN